MLRSQISDLSQCIKRDLGRLLGTCVPKIEARLETPESQVLLRLGGHEERENYSQVGQGGIWRDNQRIRGERFRGNKVKPDNFEEQSRG